MEIETEESLLQTCRSLIEAQLGWGSSDTWDTRDYERLSEKIQEATNVSLSIATLKRIWGKIRYDSRPTVTTLNTLAQFLGFENWRAFRQGQMPLSGNGRMPVVDGTPVRSKNNKRVIVVLTVIVLSIISGLVYTLWRPSHPLLDPTPFLFSSKKVVDEGVPNTVIFDYDASAAAPGDSVYIQQSWDKRLRQRVAAGGKQHTSMYFYPGFFQAKLVINDQIVREHALHITTDGWLPLIEQKPVPVYFKAADVMQHGSMQLPLSKFNLFNVPLQPVTPWAAYYNVRDFGDLYSNDLRFETEVRNDYRDGSAACQQTEVQLLFEGATLVIPLSAPGCVSNLNFMGKDGKKEDLTALGCDFSGWINVACEFSDSALNVLINRKQAFTFPLTPDSLKLAGMAFRFQGTGSVRFVRLSRAVGPVVYEEVFGKLTIDPDAVGVDKSRLPSGN